MASIYTLNDSTLKKKPSRFLASPARTDNTDLHFCRSLPASHVLILVELEFCGSPGCRLSTHHPVTFLTVALESLEFVTVTWDLRVLPALPPR